MNAVEHRIQQLVKRLEEQRELLDKLLADYAEDAAKRDLRVESAKAKPAQLSPAEAKHYDGLKAVLQTDQPLALVAALMRTKERDGGGFTVQSSDGIIGYEVPVDVSHCDCPFFTNTGRSCVHMDAARLLTRIKYKPRVDLVTST